MIPGEEALVFTGQRAATFESNGDPLRRQRGESIRFQIAWKEEIAALAEFLDVKPAKLEETDDEILEVHTFIPLADLAGEPRGAFRVVRAAGEEALLAAFKAFGNLGAALEGFRDEGIREGGFVEGLVEVLFQFALDLGRPRQAGPEGIKAFIQPADADLFGTAG